MIVERAREGPRASLAATPVGAAAEIALGLAKRWPHSRVGYAGPCRSSMLHAISRSCRGGNDATGNARRRPPSARRTLLRGFPAGPRLRASTDTDRHPDGQHVVLQHDAQSAAAPYRPAFLRAGNRMGQAADELAVHAGADDRHLGQRSDGRHHDRQSGDDGSQVSASVVRRRYRPLHDRGAGKARIELASGRRDRRILSPRLQSGRQAHRRMPSAGFHAHAAAMKGTAATKAAIRSALFVPGDSTQKLAKSLGSGADALILDLEDSVAAERKEAARATTLAFLEDT